MILSYFMVSIIIFIFKLAIATQQKGLIPVYQYFFKILFGSKLLIFFYPEFFGFFLVSTYTKGEQMVTVLNDVGTHCAVLGNHDFGNKHSFTQKISCF